MNAQANTINLESIANGENGAERKQGNYAAVTVEQEIDIPKNARGKGRKFTFKFPFDTIEIGESFQLPEDDRSIYRASVERSRAQKNFPGRRFTIRKYMGGMRVWRTS